MSGSSRAVLRATFCAASIASTALVLSTALSTASPASLAGSSSIAQSGSLRVSVDGSLRPRRLPRQDRAPIAVSVGGRVTMTDGSLQPQLKAMRIELNRHGRLSGAGLPVCNYRSIQPASTKRALAACRPSLVGTGSFAANITIVGQDPYPAKGRLLVFNSLRKGRPVLYGHIYAARPFATSFVIVFKVSTSRTGTYGTSLLANLPAAMANWGNLTGLEMTLSRRYSHRGQRLSYLSSGCPAPQGVTVAAFPLARTSFAFAGGKTLRSVLTSTCKVRR